MNERQETILRLIVEEYVSSAEPVGSRAIAEKYDLGVSPATIRNDMQTLEAEGFICQPHTSAGRVPTEQAFVHYLQRFVRPRSPSRVSERFRKAVGATQDGETAVRALAHELCELSGEMAVVAFDPRWSYRVGLSNLFDKPDFGELQVMRALSQALDRFDEILCDVFEQLPEAPRVMIGSENPFGQDMSSIMVRLRLPDGRTGLLGLVGPMRMDYGRNLGLIEEAVDALDENLDR